MVLRLRSAALGVVCCNSTPATRVCADTASFNVHGWLNSAFLQMLNANEAAAVKQRLHIVSQCKHVFDFLEVQSASSSLAAMTAAHKIL